MSEMALDSDNGVISMALNIYVQFITGHGEFTGNCDLVDRANELSAIFRNKDPAQKYEVGVDE